MRIGLQDILYSMHNQAWSAIETHLDMLLQQSHNDAHVLTIVLVAINVCGA